MTDNDILLLEMYKKSKRKKIIISLVIVFFVIIIGLSIFVISLFSFPLKCAEYSIEYGDVYEPELSDFVDLTDDINDTNTYIEYSVENADDKDYYAIGEYDVSIIHIKTLSVASKTISIPVKKSAVIVVEDTTAPVFDDNCPTEISFVINTETIDIATYFTASDLSGISSIEVYDDEVDYKTANSYTVEVVATDNNKNTASMECTVVLINEMIEISDTDISMSVGDTKQLTVSYNGTNTITYVSDNESVATVDENGIVTAKGEGSAVVTASVNDVSDVVNVAVNAKETTTASNSSSSGGSSNNTNSSNKSGSSNSSSNSSSSTTTTTTNSYPNKDFLFTDGYTMENVTEVAYAYLQASGKSGSCIPLKDEDGVYIGMRVVFN